MKKLETNDLRKLRDAFVLCDCVRDPESFQLLVDRLTARYPGIIIKSSLNHKQCVLHIIDQHQKYDRLLPHFIEEIDIYEEDSEQIQALRRIHDQIFSPPPPDDARVKRRENDWVIRIDQSNPSDIRIPSLFSDIPDDMIGEAMTPLRTWKEIHTLCEVLARNYIDVYKYIVNGDAKTAIKQLKEFREECTDFSAKLTQLQKLDPLVFDFEPIIYLRNVPSCVDSLLETMGHSEQHEYFRLGQKFADFIFHLLFEALRLADRILQKYFNQESFN